MELLRHTSQGNMRLAMGRLVLLVLIMVGLHGMLRLVIVGRWSKFALKNMLEKACQVKNEGDLLDCAGCGLKLITRPTL